MSVFNKRETPFVGSFFYAICFTEVDLKYIRKNLSIKKMENMSIECFCFIISGPIFSLTLLKVSLI